MKKSVFFIALLLILIVVAIFYIFTTKNSKKTDLNKVESGNISTENWTQFSNESLGFSIKLPEYFEAVEENKNGMRFEVPLEEPAAANPNFVYVSVIFPTDQKDEGLIYNYYPSYHEALMQLNVNEEGPVTKDLEELQEWYMYKRLPDEEVDGATARVFVNNKPWEFPEGTMEKRYIFEKDDRIYYVGAYLDAGENGISQETFSNIVNTFHFIPLKSKNTSYSTFEFDPASFSFEYPDDWVYRNDVPGCGPAFFSPQSEKIWFTVCGPYLNNFETPEQLAEQAVSAQDTLVNREKSNISGHSAVLQRIEATDSDQLQLYVAQVPLRSGEDIKNKSGTIAMYFFSAEQPFSESLLQTFDTIIQSIKID